MIRHPVSLANIRGVIGDLEGDVAQKGYQQIEQLVNRLRSEDFDNCYSSDSKRCMILAEKICKSHVLVPTYSELFREISNGNLCGEKKEKINRLVEQPDFRVPGGESLEDLYTRAKKGLDLILNKGGERNLLVSHGWYLKAFLGVQLGMDVKTAIQRLKFSNCAISEINITPGGCLVEYLNNRDYLTVR